jgi:hypothetical protein
MDDIKKFLENAKDYPDTTPIKIGDVEVPLGSLRALNSSERTTLADRMKETETLQNDYKSKQAKVVELATKAQKLVDEYTARVGALPPNDPNKRADGVNPWDDPWLQPVKSALDTRDKTITELKTLIEKANSTVANAATIWAEDRWDDQYARIDFGKREKKPTRDELIKHATEHNLLDRHKLPSVTAAWADLSKGEREEELKKAEFERGREAGRQELIASRVPPPGVSGPGQAPPPVRVPPGTGELGDLYAEAVKDPELRALLEQASGAGLV